MKLLNQTVVDILVTPNEEYEGRLYFNFALKLKSGTVFRLGSGYPIGLATVSPTKLRRERWRRASKYKGLIGKVVERVMYAYGKSEPFVVFTDGTVLRVTGEECGDIVDVESIEEIRLHKPWLLRMWRRMPEVT